MTTKKSFEDAYTKRYPVTVQFMPNKFDVNELGEYEDPAVIVGWSMWQAATAAALSAPETATDEQLRKDAERFVWYESNSEKVLNIGPCWYSRKGYGLPMKRRNGFREAIDAAMKEKP